ncbi:MAG: universal stress protein [Melioribacteraceae bacterium]|nr:MAG: universal stress protein [Melioribacteraceae bacterium]
MKAFNVKNIVIPTDFSKISYTAFNYAKEIGFMYKAKLHLVHILEDIPPVFTNGSPVSIEDKPIEKLEEEARLKLREAKEELGKSTELDIVVVVKRGVDHEEIIKYAKEIHAELIVIATHGHSGIMQTLLGSVAQKVIKNAKCPVLVTTPEVKD